LSEIGPLGDFDAICVTKDQADRLRWSQISISTPDDSSSIALRARQAQYPTSFLESKTGFMNAMSTETRSMVAATMFVALGEMKAHMDILQQIVDNEMQWQFELQTMDLRTLYRSSEKKKNKRRSTTCMAPERNLADALGLDDDADTDTDTDLGEDEVF
jgi:transaldolase